MANEGLVIGLCECGCGRRAPIATRTDSRKGARKGEPRRYLQGHSGNKGRTLDLTGAYSIDPETGCWMWQRSIHRTGYPSIGKSYGNGLAHRFFYEQANGSVPDGLHLDHLCRTRACVNPEHLEAVTNAENCRRGANAKLDHQAAELIRRRLACGETGRSIARDFDVTESAISGIKRGRNWSR